MAKKFATILGFHNLYVTNPIDADKNLNEYDLSKINPNASDEVKQNIDENTIVFIIADKTDNDILVGARKYQIKEGDRFIIAQKDVYSLFDARKIAGPTGPGAVFDFFQNHAMPNSYFPNIDPLELKNLNLQKGDYGISEEGDIWVYDGASMIPTGINLKGPTGDPGQDGQNGQNGENGAGPVVDLMGLTDTQYETFPTDTLVKGDYGISKEGDVWIYDGSELEKSKVNLKGPKGNDGATGQQGPPGESSGTPDGTTEFKDSLPIGAITMFAGEKELVPIGWLLCNGAGYNIKSVSTINIPGHGPDTDGEELFTTSWNGKQIKWQMADKVSNYVGDLFRIIKGTYRMENPQGVPYQKNTVKII